MHAVPTSPGRRILTPDPAPQGVSAAVATLMQRGQVPGLAVAVVNHDRTLFAGGFGLADLAGGLSATADTSYLWFSMTKIVTATAALRLADEGRLDLSAPAGEYVIDLRAPGRTQPTVRQLLTHTAGLNNPLPIRWVHPADTDPPDPRALLHRLMARGRAYHYPVGGLARYSNLGYLAAGQIIASAAGLPFEDYVRTSVLHPLGMEKTGFRHAPGTASATGYVRVPRIADPLLRRMLPPGIAGDRQGPYLALRPFEVDGPAYGGLIGDVQDAGRFLRMHLRDGELDGQRVLTAAGAREMRRVDLPGRPFDHGIGWFRRPTGDSEPWVEHFGAGAGFWNVMRLYPDRGLGVVVMSNGTKMLDFEPLFAHLVGASWS